MVCPALLIHGVILHTGKTGREEHEKKNISRRRIPGRALDMGHFPDRICAGSEARLWRFRDTLSTEGPLSQWSIDVVGVGPW